MDLWINLGLAWVSVILTILLSTIYILRFAAKHKGKAGDLLGKLNRSLRKHHKVMGILLVITGLVHGLFSTQKVWSFNLGTIAWIVSILLGVNWMIRKHIKKLKGWIYYHRILTVIFICTIVWHVIDVGGIQVHKVLFGSAPGNLSVTRVDPSSIKGLETQIAGNQFKDGIYTGEATGFRPGLKVSVELKDNKIINIKVTEHNEVNSRFYAAAMQLIPQKIVTAQSTSVDTVSGATFTSVGIINAVNNALSKALISGELPQSQVLPQNSGKGGHGPQGGDNARNFNERR